MGEGRRGWGAGEKGKGKRGWVACVWSSANACAL